MIKQIINAIRIRCMSPSQIATFYKKQGIKLGENCEVYRNVSFGSEPYLIDVGNNVRITTGVQFITHDGGVWVLRKVKQFNNGDVFGRIKIGNNVHIGFNAIIMPDVNIGDNCVIGCGAVVTKDIPRNSVAVGVPAKVIESINIYYDKCIKKCDYTKELSSEEKKSYLMHKFNMS